MGDNKNTNCMCPIQEDTFLLFESEGENLKNRRTVVQKGNSLHSSKQEISNENSIVSISSGFL